MHRIFFLFPTSWNLAGKKPFAVAPCVNLVPQRCTPSFYLMAASSLEANWAEDSRYDNANWYAALEHHTFPTVFFGLCCSDAEAVVAEYRARWLHAPPSSATMAAALRRLTTKLDESIAEVGGAAFVRLSSRSPKDAVCLDPAACELALAGKGTNEKLAWLFQQSMASLRVTSGEQALDIMLDSERCYRDLSAAISVAGDKMRARRRHNGTGEDGGQGSQGTDAAEGDEEEEAEEDAKQEDSGEVVDAVADAGDVGAGGDDNAWKECAVPQSLQYGWDMMVCVRRWEDQLREVRIRCIRVFKSPSTAKCLCYWEGPTHSPYSQCN